MPIGGAQRPAANSEECALDWTALWISLKVSGLAVAAMAPGGLALAWWLARRPPGVFPWLVEAVVTAPLAVPPTAVGYALLLGMGNGTALGRWLNSTAHIRLIFTWQGATVAAAVMAAPLFVRTSRAALSALDPDLLDAARTVGASDSALFWFVAVPVCARGLLAALALGWARALGEFGATIMVAGSIPGVTQTLPLSVYAAVQSGDDRTARTAALALFSVGLVIMAAVAAYESALHSNNSALGASYAAGQRHRSG